MYAFIEGTLEHKGPGELVVNAGGVGYQLLCTHAALAAAPARGEYVKVYTWLNVRQDALELIGFASPEERNMFLKLTSVSGIGPRIALNVLASMPLADLTLAILTGDAVTLSRAPGIGKKTAQRLALELKDKLSTEDLSGSDALVGLPQQREDGAVAEAILALEALGYTQSEAARAISTARRGIPEGAPADELVKLALRGMAKG